MIDLVGNEDGFNNLDYIDTSRELSPLQKRRYAQRMVKLVINQDASLGIAQDFLKRFATMLIDTHAYVKMHVREKMTPLIIRDINAMLYDVKFDEQRMIREAFATKANNISINKFAQSRKSVSYILQFLSHSSKTSIKLFK